MTRPVSINGDWKHIYDGLRPVGYVVKSDAAWKSVATGGIKVGLFTTEKEAVLAVLNHARAARVTR